MSHIEQWVPGPLPTELDDLVSQLEQELYRLQLFLAAIQNENPVPEYATEPVRPHYGQLVIANGTDWNPSHGRGIYLFDNDDTWKPVFRADDDPAVVTATVNVDNTTTETELFTMTVGANKLHLAHVYRLNLSGAYSNATGADDWVMRVKINGTTVHTITRVGGNETDAGWAIAHTFTVRSLGVSGTVIDNSVLADNDAMYTSASAAAHTINTTIAQTLSVTLQWNNAKAGNIFALTQGFMENRG